MSVVSPARSYDYIIVGAGSSGCALAHRLTEDAGVPLLLLEAGGWGRDPWLKIPLAWGRILQRQMYDWMYFAEPEAASDQCLTGQFPAHPNREFFAALQELNRAIREIFALIRERGLRLAFCP